MKGSSIPDSLGRHKPQAPPDLLHRGQNTHGRNGTFPPAAPFRMRISSILKPEQWDCDDWWCAAICLVPGLPIIMCQLNLTTVHYSGLRTPVRRSLPSWPHPFRCRFPPFNLRLYNCATESATTIIRGRNPITF